jgi:DNA polymerase/3'-5' exonuclease PolX
MNDHLIFLLEEMAEIKKALGKNPFAAKAYINASRVIKNLNQPIEQVDFNSFKGIGDKIAAGIQEFIATGTIEWYEEHKAMLPEREIETKISREQAISIGDEVHKVLKKYLTQFEIMGSVRREKSEVGDIDIGVEARIENFKKIMDLFCSLSSEILMHGERKSAIKWSNGTQIDLYTFTKKEWGPAQQFLTGNSSHNAQLRQIAKQKGMLLNQYGIWNRQTKERYDDGTEKSVYNVLGFNWVPPTERIGNVEFERYKS